MYIIQQDEFELTDFYQKKKKITLIFASKEQIPFFPAGSYVETRTKFNEQGFDFKFNSSDDVEITINYDELTIGRIAFMAYLIAKTEIEQLTNTIYQKYLSIVENDICDAMAEINMSKHFFDGLAGEREEQI